MIDYKNRTFTDTSCKNIEYMETIRGKCWDIHDRGITYAAMSRECSVGDSTIRNFSNCLRDTMNKTNWANFTKYIEETYKKLCKNDEN